MGQSAGDMHYVTTDTLTGGNGKSRRLTRISENDHLLLRDQTMSTDAQNDLAEALQQTDVDDLQARLEAARAEISLLRRELRATRQQLGQALEVRDLLREYATAMVPPRAWPRPSKKKRKPPVHLLVEVSDWQIGEKTDPKQTDDWGRFNYAIAQRRVQTYLECLLRFMAVQRSGYRLDDCYVVALGDLISGDIHEDLRRTNEFPPPVQAIAAGRLFAQFVSTLSAHFRRVEVHCIGGSNHGRLTPRYQFKDGTLNNWDWVVYEYIAALLQRHTNVSVYHYLARKALITIARYNFLCSHGDHVVAWMGIPWYGIERDLGREARRRLERVMEQIRQGVPVSAGFDYGLGAHWHVPFVGPNFSYLINGSLTGTSELGHVKGLHAPPQQVAALVSPNHGLFAPIAWRLDTGEEMALMKIDGMDLVLGRADAS